MEQTISEIKFLLDQSMEAVRSLQATDWYHVLEIGIRSLIDEDEKEKIDNNIGRALKMIVDSSEADGDSGKSALRKLCVQCAETAIWCHNLGTCTEALSWLPSFTSATGGTDDENSEEKDQVEQEQEETDEYTIRSLYCRGMLEFACNYRAKGESLVQALQRAMEHISSGMALGAEDKDRFSSLVFEGSKHIWNMSRKLNKDGVRHYLVQVFQQACDVLQKIDHDDITWTIHLLIQLSLCQYEAGKGELANKTISLANDINTKKNENEAAETRQMLQDRIFQFQNLYGQSKGKRGSKAQPRGGSAVQMALSVIQSVRKNTYADDKQAVKELLDTYKTLASGGIKQTPRKGKRSRPTTPASSRSKSGHEPSSTDTLEALSMIGFECSRYYCGTDTISDLSAAIAADKDGLQRDQELRVVLMDCIRRCAASTSLKARTYGEFSAASLVVQSLSPRYRERLTQKSVNARLRAIKMLEQAIQSAQRLPDAYSMGEALHDGCIMLWNMCLPLLQSNLRSHIRRPLQLIATALEEIDSNATLLRAMVHLEIAKCDIADDVLAKANEHAKKAYALDYVVSEDHHAHVSGLERPLDRHLEPILQQLDLKTNVYREPNRIEEEAFLTIEQAKETSDPGLKESLLEKAMAMLRTAEENELKEHNERWKRDTIVSVDSKDEQPPPHRVETDILRQRFHLWADIVITAWRQESRMIEVTQSAAQHVMKIGSEREWDIVRDREIHIQSAQIHFSLAETYVLELNQQNLSLDSVFHPAENENTEFHSKDLQNAERIHIAQMRILEHIESAIEIGKLSSQHWIVVNGCVYFWNLHFALLVRHKKFLPFQRTLSKCYNALIDSTMLLQDRDYVVLSRIAFGLVNSLLQEYVSEKNPKFQEYKPLAHGYTTEDSTYHSQLLEMAYQTGPNSGSSQLKYALEICEKVIPLLSRLRPYMARELVFQKTKVQYLLTGKPYPTPLKAGSSDEEMLLIYCEMLRQPHTNEQARVKVLKDGSDFLIQVCKNVEIFATFAGYALRSGDYKLAIRICEHCDTLLPKDAFEPDNDGDAVHKITKRQWRWYALTNVSCARATFALVDPNTQDRKTQMSICVKALGRLAQAMLFGRRSTDSKVCIHIAEAAFPVTANILRHGSALDLLIVPLQNILKRSAHVVLENKHERDLFEELYDALFIAMRECGEFQQGIEWVNMALAHLPVSHHRNVWQFDIEFRCRSEANYKQSIARVQGYGAEVQAKVFAMLGHFSSSVDEKRLYFTRAIDALKKDRFLRASYMIEYAGWLYSNGFGATPEPMQLLAEVARTLVSMECALLVNEDDTMDDASQSDERSLSDSSSSSSLQSTPSSSRKSGISQNPESSVQSVRNGVSSDGISNVLILDQLGQCFALMSCMALSPQDELDLALSAHNCYVRIIHLCSKQIFQEVQQIRENPGEDMEREGIPQLPEEWIGFSLDPGLRKMWTSSESKRSTCAIDKATIRNPGLTLFYLIDVLCKKLMDHGYHVYCLPLHEIARIISEDIIQDQRITSLVHLKTALLYEQLALPDLSAKYRKLADPIGITDDIKQQLKEEREARTIKRSSAAEYATGQRTFGRQMVMDRAPSRWRVWMEQSRILIQLGEVSLAQDLVKEARQDAEAFDDVNVLAQCDILDARIHHLQEELETALDHIVRARTRDVSLHLYREIVTDTVRLLLEKEDLDRAVEFSQQAVDVVDSSLWKKMHGRKNVNASAAVATTTTTTTTMKVSPATADVEAVVQLSLLDNDLAMMFLSFAEKKDAHIDMRMIESMMSRAFSRLKNAEFKCLNAVRIGRNYAQIILQQLESSKDTDWNRLKQLRSLLEYIRQDIDDLVAEAVPLGSIMQDRYPIVALHSEVHALSGRAELLIADAEYSQLQEGLVGASDNAADEHADKEGGELTVVEKYIHELESELEKLRAGDDAMSVAVREPAQMSRLDKAKLFLSSVLGKASAEGVNSNDEQS